jgi:AcrR family transcriptional regulator
MPRQRFLKLEPERREFILDAARSEFAENGFEKASYNQIIERAGLSKGAMYYYFDDKLDLYVTVLEDASQRMMEAMSLEQLWPPGDDFWGSMRTMSHKAWQFALERPELATLFKGITALPRKDRREGRVGELYGYWRSLMEQLLRAGQAQGEVRDDVPLDLLVEVGIGLDEAMDMWLLENMDQLADDPAEQIADMIVDFWRRLLAPRAE